MPARSVVAPRLAPFVLLAALACEIGPPVDAEPVVTHTPIRIPDPVPPASEGTSADLLQQYVERPPIEARKVALWELTFQSKLLAIALLITAGRDRIEDLPIVLAPDATWGLPDPRRFGERPIFDGDHGEAFLAAFRRAARRLPMNATYKTQPLPDGVQGVVRIGAEPYWTYWVNDRDRIYMRQIVRQGRPYIDYVGFFEELPEQPLQVAERVIPPLVAPVRSHAGDVVTPIPATRMPVPTPDP